MYVKILVLFAIILLLFPLEKVLYKLLGVEKKKISDTSGKNIDRWSVVLSYSSFYVRICFLILVTSL